MKSTLEVLNDFPDYLLTGICAGRDSRRLLERQPVCDLCGLRFSCVKYHGAFFEDITILACGSYTPMQGVISGACAQCTARQDCEYLQEENGGVMLSCPFLEVF